MPFPLGHTAIALATYETAQPAAPGRSRIGLLVYITLLANLPDLDILLGLIAQGNGAAYHRGPTHSLLFALIAGFLAYRAGRWWPRIPPIGFGLCFLLIFSHILADMLLTASPVSLFWPFEIYWSQGHSGWAEVIGMALFQGAQDFIIAVVAAAYLLILRKLRGHVCLAGLCIHPSRRRAR
jgi:hypothetical protein